MVSKEEQANRKSLAKTLKGLQTTVTAHKRLSVKIEKKLARVEEDLRLANYKLGSQLSSATLYERNVPQHIFDKLSAKINKLEEAHEKMTQASNTLDDRSDDLVKMINNTSRHLTTYK